MPLYKFECDRCGAQDTRHMTFEEHDAYRKLTHQHVMEGEFVLRSGEISRTYTCGEMKQVIDFHINLGMREHYSHQLDMNVTSDQHFNNELKRQQDEYQARMGMEVNFETIDPNDPVAAGVTDAGLEEQARAHHDEASDGHRSIFT